MTAQIYVGTYAKYNNGSIGGQWVNLEQFDDATEFLKHCAEIHHDEEDPEFMFQDFEGFPKALYSECSVSDDIWFWLGLDEDEQEMLEAYIACMGTGTGFNEETFEAARDAYYGHYENDTEMAECYADDTGLLNSIPEHLQRYFDFESFGRDLSHDFMESNGYYFHNY
jgi:antirestriction protein